MIDAAAKQAIVFTQDSDAPQSQRTLLHRHRQPRRRTPGGPAHSRGDPGGRHRDAVRRQARRAERAGARAGHPRRARRLEHPHPRRPHRRCRRRAGEGERRRHAGALSRRQGAGRPLELQRSRDPQRRARRRQDRPGEDHRVRRGRRDAGRASAPARSTATVVQQPYEFGYQAIHRMAQAVARRPVLHPRVEADHRPHAGREPRQRRDVHETDQRAARAHQ